MKKLQQHFLQGVRQEGRISLSGLIEKYGPEVDVRNTPSDKNLVKRQMDQLAAEGEIQFYRVGRELIAQIPQAKSAGAEGQPQPAASTGSPKSPNDLAVIRAFALQLEEFSRTLQEQISTLVRMVEKASR
ncbi:MAG: hypothetical protein ACE15E_23320 [Acidobacteriota bacterium]